MDTAVWRRRTEKKPRDEHSLWKKFWWYVVQLNSNYILHFETNCIKLKQNMVILSSLWHWVSHYIKCRANALPLTIQDRFYIPVVRTFLEYFSIPCLCVSFSSSWNCRKHTLSGNGPDCMEWLLLVVATLRTEEALPICGTCRFPYEWIICNAAHWLKASPLT